MLYDQERPLWKAHPMGQDVDVAALTLNAGQLSQKILPAPVNLSDEASEWDMRTGNEVFVVGFPGNVATQLDLPIWKRGTIASEPLLNDKSEGGKFLIDSATRQGLSGSPVYAVRRGGVIFRDGRFEDVPHRFVFIGVYSGRINDNDAFAAQIGIVWHLGFIAEVVKNSFPGGGYEIRNPA